ncbi:TPA: rhomboid family intramembrane serine protease [Morganella morganii subsp. morganii]|uniref:Rhomboid family intramembrane serine protease n=1 Tax=Morganella morganii TaxID=582 RepID=A0AAU8ZQY8_MORMO|nr:rhomboid family intramembrane serine protease [Morganella morganii]HDU8691680.1 rhomboid family intramembrane serine protease [Morganella morganii subsp. morganii]AWC95189.1 rhomboid family intramembrane serine protease [Morganella morganii]EKW8484283.1 rhomboid family intramembrane serine protease [Morganella morganii]HAT3623332.1 rhomboid family intramembrane serine protease [Morganella morganii]HCU0876794.1 rhomboid family intramembrane serine protease [Morganella morganii]
MTKNTLNNTEQSAQSGIKIYLRNGLYFVLFLMVVQLLTTLTGGGLTALGIEPRTVNGLFGIFLAPFIHSSWGHLFSNLPPLLILSVLLMIPSVKHYIKASLFIIIVGGLLVWLFGRTAVHVGASGWIFGLWALLIYQGIFRRKPLDIIIGIVVLIYYGGMISGLFPGQQFVSVESHLSGAAAGVLFGWLQYRKRKQNNNPA